MNYSYLCAHPASHPFPSPYSAATSPPTWLDHGPFLPPIHGYPPRPLTLVSQDWGGGHVEYHHFYGLNPLALLSPYWPWPYSQPARPQGYGPGRSQAQIEGSWPEGFTLRGELRWGKLDRVYGPRRELPDFVKEDLRRVYGTYPRTDLCVTFQGGEYVVRGDPRVGEQEYKVEKKVMRQVETPEEGSTSETAEKRKKQKKKAK
nr:PREDICTED: uncharacterized protein LOC107077410 [Lepisosteus oculatus]XP_015203169.1 PREDICTED: uncharacterized protein LOC107077410 [Lepisosteus oculatus]